MSFFVYNNLRKLIRALISIINGFTHHHLFNFCFFFFSHKFERQLQQQLFCLLSHPLRKHTNEGKRLTVFKYTRFLKLSTVNIVDTGVRAMRDRKYAERSSQNTVYTKYSQVEVANESNFPHFLLRGYAAQRN